MKDEVLSYRDRLRSLGLFDSIYLDNVYLYVWYVGLVCAHEDNYNQKA
jgi:hypothetical protein